MAALLGSQQNFLNTMEPPTRDRIIFATVASPLDVFLGPRGPLVLPLVGPVPSRPVRPALKIWITYIQAYMPYES